MLLQCQDNLNEIVAVCLSIYDIHVHYVYHSLLHEKIRLSAIPSRVELYRTETPDGLTDGQLTSLVLLCLSKAFHSVKFNTSKLV